MGSVEAYDGTTVMAADRTPLVPEAWVVDAACKGKFVGSGKRVCHEDA